MCEGVQPALLCTTQEHIAYNFNIMAESANPTPAPFQGKPYALVFPFNFEALAALLNVGRAIKNHKIPSRLEEYIRGDEEAHFIIDFRKPSVRPQMGWLMATGHYTPEQLQTHVDLLPRLLPRRTKQVEADLSGLIFQFHKGSGGLIVRPCGSCNNLVINGEAISTGSEGKLLLGDEDKLQFGRLEYGVTYVKHVTEEERIWLRNQVIKYWSARQWPAPTPSITASTREHRKFGNWTITTTGAHENERRLRCIAIREDGAVLIARVTKFRDFNDLADVSEPEPV